MHWSWWNGGGLLIKRLAILILALTSVAVPARAQLATATVTPTNPGKSVQPNFGGITTDVFSSATMMGTPANGANPIYRQLAKNLIYPRQSLFFTMEGDDNPSATMTADIVLGHANVFTDLQAAGFTASWHMPANMCSNNQSFANGEVNLYTANMPIGSLAGIVLGNEPDGACSATYGANYAAFKTKWDTYRAGINGLVGASNLNFMAPSFGGELSNVGYRGNLNSFVTAEASVLSVGSQHWYALNNTSAGCGGNTPTISQLLAPGAATPATIDSNFPSYVTNAHAQGLPFRVSEMNSVVCGGFSGVSNTFAASLWLTDAMFNLANMGVDGVGIFSDIGDFYDLFGFTIGGTAPNKTYTVSFIRPEYYGFMMFQEATQRLAKLVPCTITTSSNVTCWATIDDMSTVRVVLINKDQVATGNVTITLAGYGQAQLKLLTAPAVTSTTGVTYGGQTFDGSTDGNLVGANTSTLITPSGTSYTFAMAKASAAMLTLLPTIRHTAPGWQELFGTRLTGGSQNATPCVPNNYNGYVYPFAAQCFNIIEDPDTAVPDLQRNRLILWGGGHNDYLGNDIDSLELNNIGTASPALIRLDPPAAPIASSATGTNDTRPACSVSVGCLPTTVTPNARHTYDGGTYVPQPLDLLVQFSGALSPNGFSGQNVWHLNLNSVTAACAPNCDPAWTQGVSYPGNVGVASALDPSTGLIWSINQASLLSYNPTTQVLTTQAASSNGSFYTGVFDTVHRYFVMVGSVTPFVFYYNIAAGAPYTRQVPTTSGCSILQAGNGVGGPGGQGVEYPGAYFDPITEKVIFWPNAGNTVWYLDTNTWTCTGSNYGARKFIDYPQNTKIPPGSAAAGTFKKFGGFPNLNKVALCNDGSANCWLLTPRAAPLTIANSTGSTVTNYVFSRGRPFAQGDIPNFPQAYVTSGPGTISAPVLTQADVKNRWSDGSVKFAIVSFIVPSIPNGQNVNVDFDDQPTGNNTGALTAAQMLAAPYNFDARIQLTGTASPTISARTILSAGACGTPTGQVNSSGGDIDGTIAGGSKCTYWQQGPIVTSIILEDRSAARAYDVNTDAGTGNPLHPIFEVKFIPQGAMVEVGYTLEDMWASTTAANSARDQTYSVVLTGGATGSLTTVYSQATLTQNTRTAWHQTWCVLGNGVGTRDGCGPNVHIDNNWAYVASTRALPNWDATLQLSNSLISGQVANFNGKNRGLTGVLGAGQQGAGLYPSGTTSGCSNCGGIDATGAASWHGPLQTEAIVYLMSQCDAGNSTSPACGNGAAGDMRSVVVGQADLGYELQYFYREADQNAGFGTKFDAAGTVNTLGRVVSINARQQVQLGDVTQKSCSVNHAADWINFGGAGQTSPIWGINNLDTSHWPNVAYVAYLTTGQYAYYEEQLMQSAYALGESGGANSSRACIDNTRFSVRQGNLGYWISDQERGQNWQAREHAIGAFIALDNSPEKAYFTDKLQVNLAMWEGEQAVANDIPGNRAAAYTYGQNRAAADGNCGGTFICVPPALGGWGTGQTDYPQNPPLIQGVGAPAAADAHFQLGYSAVTVGWIDDLGFCPHPVDHCKLLDSFANYYANQVLNPAATNGGKFALQDYVYPTRTAASAQITQWSQMAQFYASVANAWPACPTSAYGDDGYIFIGAAAMSYLTSLTSVQGNFSGQTAYNNVRSTMGCVTGGVGTFQSTSPKWDILPRIGAVPVAQVSSPNVTLTPPTIAFANQSPGTTSLPQSVTLTNNGQAALVLGTPYYTRSGTNATDFAVVGGTCANGGTVAINSSCTISIAFTPAATGSKSALLTINGNGTGSMTLTGVSINIASSFVLGNGIISGGGQIILNP